MPLDIYKYRTKLAMRGDMDNTTMDDIQIGSKILDEYHADSTGQKAVAVMHATEAQVQITDKGHFCPRCGEKDGVVELYAYEGFASLGVIRWQDFGFDYGMDAYDGAYICPCGKNFKIREGQYV